MSVAFRREQDDEHKEPVFELPLPAGPNLVTARGLTLTRARVDELEAAVAAATESERTGLQRQLRYWRTRLATAQLAPVPAGDAVAFGSRVTICEGAAKRTLDLVGDDEAEPTAGRLAFSAPLARALLGAEPGERVTFGSRQIELVETGPIPV